MNPKEKIIIEIFPGDKLRANFMDMKDGTITDIWEAGALSMFRLLLKRTLPHTKYDLRKVRK